MIYVHIPTYTCERHQTGYALFPHDVARTKRACRDAITAGMALETEGTVNIGLQSDRFIHHGTPGK